LAEFSLAGARIGCAGAGFDGAARVGKAVVPWWNYLLALFRYALIGLIVYAIFVYRNIPLASMFFGLCALAAAAIAASVWEILTSG
jgi:hypothetical protein